MENSVFLDGLVHGIEDLVDGMLVLRGCPRIGGFGGEPCVLAWSCPRNWGFGGRHASFDGVCPRIGRFGGRTIVVELVLVVWEVLPV